MHLAHLMRRNSVKNAAEKLRTDHLLDAATRAAIRALAAVASTLVAEGHPWKDMVRLAFIVVLLLIAGSFGVRTGLLGTILAALVFAMFLLAPTGSLNVTDDSARSNLGWMLLIGLAF